MLSIPLSVSVWQKLNDLDKWLFLKINSQFTNPVFDAILPFFRASAFWAPLYLFLTVFAIFNFKKKGFWWSVGFLVTVAITDQAGGIIKYSVQRLRPCQDPYFLSNVRLMLEGCSSSFSFVSNHAANHFGLATFIVLTFRQVTSRWINLAFVWAALISYAQMYVGIHYPSDILGGMILGILAGYFTSTVFNNNIATFILEQ